MINEDACRSGKMNSDSNESMLIYFEKASIKYSLHIEIDSKVAYAYFYNGCCEGAKIVSHVWLYNVINNVSKDE